jgi:hypothetical protein
MEKKKTLVQQYNIFLILTMKKYFYCLKIYEKLKKNPWSTVLNLVDFRVKKYFYKKKKQKKNLDIPNNLIMTKTPLIREKKIILP